MSKSKDEEMYEPKLLKVRIPEKEDKSMTWQQKWHSAYMATDEKLVRGEQVGISLVDAAEALRLTEAALQSFRRGQKVTSFKLN